MVILLSGFVGAFIGASITLLFNIWKFHRDERTARCDELCSAMSAAAVLASEYWANEFPETTDEPNQRTKEARILGAQALIDGIYSDLRPVFKEQECEKVDALLSALFDAMSGGDFSVLARARDVFRVAAGPQAASAAIVEVRRCHRHTIPFYRIIQAFHDNKRRKLDMPASYIA